MRIKSRHPYALTSIFGVSYFHHYNPVVVAWWSAAFPGFGQYLMNQYIRATLLTLIEVVINTLANINEGIVYTFCGDFERARAVIQPRWVFGYVVIYFYAIWDSYRSAVHQNKLHHLAELEDNRFSGLIMNPLEIQYIEQKSPYTAAVYSFLFPGLGQVYNHRFGLGIYAMFWWWFYITFSHYYEAFFYFIIGDFIKSSAVLEPHWLLFMPSVIGGSVYFALITAIEHNRLFKIEQRRYLKDKFNSSEVNLFNGQVDKF